MTPPAMTLDQAMRAAQRARDSGDIEAARKLYQQILKAAPAYKPAFDALAQLPAPAAAPAPRRKVPPARGAATAFRADMEALQAMRDRESSETVYHEARRLAAKYPDQPMPLNIEGVALAGVGAHREAAEVLRKARALAPDYVNVSQNLGRVLALLAEIDEACAVLEDARARDPRDPRTQLYLGDVYRRLGRLEEARDCVDRALDAGEDDADAHHVHGSLLQAEGAHSGALAAYKRALELNPGLNDVRLEMVETLKRMRLPSAARDQLLELLARNPGLAQGHLSLGILELKQDNLDAAAACFEKVLELVPGDPEAMHFLATARGEVEADHPVAYTASVFDGYAPRFEQHLVEGLKYDGPNILRRLFDEVGSAANLVAADLGCGTGLGGVAFGDRCASLVGVDVSARMLDRAREKGIYTDLVCADVVAWLDQDAPDLDLALAADSLIYIGRLDPVFAALARKLRPGGYFLFTTELLEADDADLRIRLSGRYAHSHAYIQRLAAEHGFSEAKFMRGGLRKEAVEWIEGGYYVLVR